MASSRIFIKGLPPNISEDEFKKHFAAKHSITDAKLIPHRRIGYIGYKSSKEAENAVKYFNKSFIRMSKIGVEIARPISDATLPTSRKAQREKTKDLSRTKEIEKAANAITATTQKRKRIDVDEADPKLQEFLEVMQPASKTNKWPTSGISSQAVSEPPMKMQAVELPEGESDDDYETVPKKTLKKNMGRKEASGSGETAVAEKIESSVLVEITPAATIETDQPVRASEATDDDWLRLRTNRLLDLDPVLARSSAPSQQAANLGGNVGQGDSSQVNEHDDEKVVGEDFNEESHEVIDAAEVLDHTLEAIKTNGRLFVRNLPYTASEQDLREHFETFGALEEIHLPLDASGTSKGFVLVQFEDPSAAVEAFHNTDGEPFQGRLLHILPAAAKRNNKLDEFQIAKLPLKKQKQIKKRAEASATTFNWNSMYMSQDAVNSSVADRLGVSKSELLDPTSADAGVKQAIAETSIIQETKAYFASNGVYLDSFKRRERGDTAILVKNFPYGMSVDELRKMFEEFGQVLRVLMPPTGTIAIVEFAQAPQARAAFASLAYRRIKDSVLFLEKAPKDLFVQASSSSVSAESAVKPEKTVNPRLSAADLLEKESGVAGADTSTLFVNNLSFDTTSARLAEIFKPLGGFMSARVNTKTDPKKPGLVLSMGFGFLEFRSKAQAQAALSSMDGYSLDGHKLSLRASHKGLDAAEERRKDDRARKLAGKRTKIVIKNLPFEATKKDVRALFGTYGQLRSVRVPKKFDNSARGFAFADFVTAREAENALEALKDTHLLGRRLVIEFATEDALDAEEEIEKMQKKVGKQVNKVALQKLTGGGRKKFNIEGDENDE